MYYNTSLNAVSLEALLKKLIHPLSIFVITEYYFFFFIVTQEAIYICICVRNNKKKSVHCFVILTWKIKSVREDAKGKNWCVCMRR